MRSKLLEMAIVGALLIGAGAAGAVVAGIVAPGREAGTCHNVPGCGLVGAVAGHSCPDAVASGVGSTPEVALR